MLEQIRPLFIWDSHKSVAPPIQRKAAVIQSGDGTNDAAANKRQIRSGGTVSHQHSIVFTVLSGPQRTRSRGQFEKEV